MGVGLSWKIERSGSEARIALSGEITEDSNFAPLLSEESDRITLDLADIKRINSCGVREWVNFVGALGKTGKRFAFERCSVPFVNQLNMITSFRGGGEVRSVFAPYVCPASGHEELRLVQLIPGAVPGLKVGVPCTPCQKSMELDDIAETYLAFQG